MVCWYWRNCRPSLFKHSFVLLILKELLTITVQTFFWFVDIGGIVDHHCSNFLLVCWYWMNCWSSLWKLSFGLLILEELSTITVKTFFVLLILVELLTITVQTFFWFVDIGGIVDHHCSNFILVCLYWRNYWPSLFKLSLGLLILEELLTITVKTLFWFVGIGGIVDHHC